MKKQQSGFTLIEIAIVMVIIGLLLGGVLKGQEVITNARIKNVNNDFSGISAAVFSYQDRYAALPGDDFAAVAHLGATAVQSDGTVGTVGNGVIEGAYAAADDAVAATDNETTLAWHHLRSSGLISGAATGNTSNDQPVHAMGGITGIATGNGVGGATNGLSGLNVFFAGVDGEMAAILDAQSDDSNADAGTIRHVTNATGYVFGTAADMVFEM